MRDLSNIYSKLLTVLWPRGQSHNQEVLREWDLWGPLVICLSLAIILSLSVSNICLDFSCGVLYPLNCRLMLTNATLTTVTTKPIYPCVFNGHFPCHHWLCDCHHQRQVIGRSRLVFPIHGLSFFSKDALYPSFVAC